ncbi:MAG: NADH-quinone oxidoreductase subunit M, partial [Desulfotomaculales bacterium]
MSELTGGFPLLLTILVAPVAAAIILTFVPREEKLLIKCIAAAGTFTSMALAFYAFFSYDKAAGGVQFVQQIPWIKDLGVTFYLGVDGVSLPLMLLI